MKSTVSVFAFLIVVLAAELIFMYSWEKETCNSLKTQSEAGLTDFYITKNDKDMCDALHVEIDAPVK